MTHLESARITLSQSAESVYEFLVKPENHRGLMPDGIADFTASDNTMHFVISGTGPLNLLMQEAVPNERITFVPHIKIPFPFQFHWKIEKTENGCIVWNELNAEMNMMIRMLAEKPLSNFIKAQAEKLPAVLSAV